MGWSKKITRWSSRDFDERKILVNEDALDFDRRLCEIEDEIDEELEELTEELQIEEKNPKTKQKFFDDFVESGLELPD